MSGDVTTWSLEDLSECSPGDYLIGCIEGRWTGDDKSQGEAIIALLSATYAEMAGMDPEAAVDLAIEQVEAGVGVSWDGNNLSFDFDRADPEGSEAP